MQKRNTGVFPTSNIQRIESVAYVKRTVQVVLNLTTMPMLQLYNMSDYEINGSVLNESFGTFAES
jgi:hypothetical protein